MTRLHRTRKDSIVALQQALQELWDKVHIDNIDFKNLKLSDISRKHRISTLPCALVKPYVVCERQPTFAAAAKLREILTINSRAKGGKRNYRQTVEQPIIEELPLKRQRPQATLFNFNNVEAVEDITNIQDLLNANGYKGYGIEVVLREDSYTLKLEITKQTKSQKL